MKILHLVLFNDKPIYNNMYKITSPYYKKFQNINTIYYKFGGEELEEDYVIKDDIMLIKGKETFIPGILDKTIKALQYYEKEIDNYDFIIRSNVSTIIDFKRCQLLLKNNPNIEYGGGIIENLQWFGSGVNDRKYFGTIYCQGISIILNKDLTKHILSNLDKLNMTIIDDVSLAILIKELKNDITYTQIPCVSNFLLNNNKFKSNFIVYRNKFHNRNVDVKRMEIIIKNLIKNLEITN